MQNARERHMEHAKNMQRRGCRHQERVTAALNLKSCTFKLELRPHSPRQSDKEVRTAEMGRSAWG